MRVAIMIGDDRTAPETQEASEFLSVDRLVYPGERSNIEELFQDLLRNGDDIAVLQYGSRADHEYDIIDRAIELGIPVFEFI